MCDLRQNGPQLNAAVDLQLCLQILHAAAASSQASMPVSIMQWSNGQGDMMPVRLWQQTVSPIFSMTAE